MKKRRCRDCKNQEACQYMVVYYADNDMDIEKAVPIKCQRDRFNHYHRKWWKFWAAK